MIKQYKKVVRTPLNLQQVVKVEQIGTLDDGSEVWSHTKQPVFAPPPPLPKYNDPTKEDLLEIVRLRKEDPNTYTLSVLAEKFRVPRHMIANIAPASEERLEYLEELKTEQSLQKKKRKKTGIAISNLQKMNREKYQKMVAAAGGLKQLLTAQNMIKRPPNRHYDRRPKKKESLREPLAVKPGKTDDDPVTFVNDASELLNWVTSADMDHRRYYEQRINVFKELEDPNYVPPGPKAEAQKPGAKSSGGSSSASASKAPPPKSPPPKKK